MVLLIYRGCNRADFGGLQELIRRFWEAQFLVLAGEVGECHHISKKTYSGMIHRRPLHVVRNGNTIVYHSTHMEALIAANGS